MARSRTYPSLLALLMPFLAFAIQRAFWPTIQPYAWFLFYPAVFFSSWLGGLRTGLVSTFLSTALVWWAFVPPEHLLVKGHPRNFLSVGVFVGMGILFSLFQGRLRRAIQQADEALAAVREANLRMQAAHEELARLYERTKELDELKTQFYANVSHELRTPLTLILGPVEAFLSRRDLPEEDRRHLEMVRRNAAFLHHQVSDLLDVAKLEAKRMDVRYAPDDLAKIVRLAASHFESAAEGLGIRLALDLPGTLPGQFDGEKCQRILLNLLSNALKFTPPGGAVALSLAREGDRGLLRIQDTGPGIPEPLREMVFERFRQVEGGAERRHGGTGLGLAIVREFVELQGGTIRAGEAPGGGALFEVSLPLFAPEGAEIQAAVALPPVSPGDLPHPEASRVEPLRREGAAHILVVEDNPDMNLFVSGILGARYRVTSTRNGQEALDRALEDLPDLVLSDVMMPVMGGERLVQAMRSHPFLEQVPIVILTAKADPSLELALLRHGVQDFLTKPFSSEQLLARVEGILADRRATREKLAGNRARLRLLAAALESAAEAISITDHAGLIEWTNPAFSTLTGFGLEETLGVPLGACLDPVRPGFHESLWRAVQGGEVWRGEVQGRRKDGTPSFGYLTITPVLDGPGARPRYVAVQMDLTSLREGKARLLASEGRYRSLFQNMLDAYVHGRMDFAEGGPVDYTYLEVNPAFERLTGLRDVVDRRVGEVLPGFREGNPELFEALGRVARGGNPERLETYLVPLRIWVSISAFHVGEGEFVAVFDDISGRKRTEQDLRRWNAELEYRVNARTTELQAANEELESFAYAVSHDLRAPLRAMSGFSQALVEDYGGQLDPEAHGYLDQITLASHRMGDLIDGLLRLSRSLRDGLALEDVDLSALARRIRDELSAGEPQRRVDWRIEEGLVVHGDPRMLDSVLRNLLGNAWKYTSRTAAPSIRFHATGLGRDRSFCVSDNGAGFDMAYAGKLFTPFQRLHRQDEFPGLGIGLATASRIIHRHGGTLEAEGVPGQGATFRFRLSPPPGQA